MFRISIQKNITITYITYAKTNFKIILPPSYEREVWHFNRAEINLIRRSISNFNWDKAFEKLSTNDQVKLFTDTLLNIFRNFIPHETIKSKAKDPPWMNGEIKSALRRKNRLYKKFTSGSMRNQDKTQLNEVTDFTQNLISSAKENYYMRIGEKLNNPAIGSKTYWSILNRVLDKIKIPLIPPILFNNSFITDFKEKANIFNLYFVNQCNIINNGSTIPEVIYKTNHRSNGVTFCNDDISKIIKNLNPSKAHGFDGISIKMIKMCGESIVPPLSKIIRNAIKSGIFPDEWKKGNIVPVHKKANKQFIANYRPISLLPIFAKIFEKLIYNSLFEYFHTNNFLSANQSGFRTGDSCVFQLISITHELYKAFDANPSLETRGVFLDISKAFDKVWHEGLLHKLKCYGVDGELYKIIENYLKNRKQRVVLNGQHSSWKAINAGVPQGSVLGPLLFLIYINDLPENLISVAKLFADDTSIFSTVVDINKSTDDLNKDLSTINSWALQWKMSFNPDPNKQATEVVFSRKLKPAVHPSLYLNAAPVSNTLFQKHLGLILDKKLLFRDHLNEKITRCNKGIGLIKRLSKCLPRKTLLTIYKSFVRPHLDYADVIYDQPHNSSFCNKIESVQYNAALAITGCIKGTSKEKLYQELGIESLGNRRWYRRLILFYKIVNSQSPVYLKELPSRVQALL